ncbi:hypothetical protein Micbo1qcDRAFT_9281 [Microdochium bolleyi]|uniref:Uncharacterized protein n=1 Tax=Microdochium bolleyi TaxID=196109 RepID=A0A136JKK5_9PEZI|nr:hypothetical protein Micbo1qcDRAFT_9281 [Microdochium bolleyi]
MHLPLVSLFEPGLVASHDCVAMRIVRACRLKPGGVCWRTVPALLRADTCLYRGSGVGHSRAGPWQHQTPFLTYLEPRAREGIKSRRSWQRLGWRM